MCSIDIAIWCASSCSLSQTCSLCQWSSRVFEHQIAWHLAQMYPCLCCGVPAQQVPLEHRRVVGEVEVCEAVEVGDDALIAASNWSYQMMVSRFLRPQVIVHVGDGDGED